MILPSLIPAASTLTTPGLEILINPLIGVVSQAGPQLGRLSFRDSQFRPWRSVLEGTEGGLKDMSDFPSFLLLSTPAFCLGCHESPEHAMYRPRKPGPGAQLALLT